MAWNQPGNNGQDRDPWGAAITKAATLGEMAIKVVASRGRPIWMISSAS
jgi:hypothetical protein